MIATCDTCGATYNIADDKVRGRRVRLRCKTCQNAILLDGNALALEDSTREYAPSFDDDAGGGDGATRVMSAGAAWEGSTRGGGTHGSGPGGGAGSGGAWSVSLTDDDQRSMTTEEIAEAYAAGGLPDDTFVWKEGFSDWRPLLEIPDLMEAIEQASAATRVVAPRRSVPPPTPAVRAAGVATYTAPAPVEQASRPAARIVSPRGAGRDLFGASAEPGAPRAPRAPDAPRGPRAGDDDHAGASGGRHENSVLFSLDALKAGQGRNSPPLARGTAAPTAADILGLGSVPSVSPLAAINSADLLRAPVASAPPPVAASDSRDTTPPTRRAGLPLPWIAAGAGTIVAVAVVAVLVLRSGGNRSDAAASAAGGNPHAATAEPVTAQSSSAQPSSAQPSSAQPSSAQPGTEAPGAAPAPRATEPSAAPPAPPSTAASLPAAAGSPPLRGAAKSTSGGTSGGTTGSTSPTRDQASAGAAPASATKPAAAGTVTAAKVELEETPAKEEPAAPAAPPFDANAAKAALSAAASQAGSCAQPDGPTGTGRVTLTFMPSGRATSANITAGPFTGTPVGGCVARLFRSAKIAPFSGDPVTVSKSFTIP